MACLTSSWANCGLEGLTAHPAKTFRGESKASFWGIFANGESGLVRASPSRVIPLLEITARTALIGYASVALLETLAGSWVAVLQVRRRMLSLLDHIYTAQQLRERDDIVKLSAALVQELWLLVILGPLSVSVASSGIAASLPCKRNLESFVEPLEDLAKTS